MNSLLANLRGILKARRAPLILPGHFAGRQYTGDSSAFQFRMGAGFPGDVNRTHPASIEPVTLDATNPPLLYGSPGVIDTVTHLFRRFLSTDGALVDAYGILVRPFPTQQKDATNFGTATLGVGGPNGVDKADVLREGYIMVTLNNYAAAPSAKGGTVYIWIAATAGAHVQNQFESQASGGNTIALPTPSCTFNGSPDSNGNVEIVFHR